MHILSLSNNDVAIPCVSLYDVGSYVMIKTQDSFPKSLKFLFSG